ncbi:hypothetical protein HHL17_32040 [Chitinophaga sp. G-6-1-13]|uniref:Uncharacterized protein n=1 Tax=Chitinophaga fulva TaxID=2728842 RepID=A0A848GX19_9BACT|nr:hypothetical protein [Chitinophaga fulva]NML41859.1 hypothetical protein [Chitinophaga fulva]
MFTGFFSSSLQRRFCEGFLFYPIRRLRQYGGYIFKQYKSKSGIKTLLENQRQIFDFNGFYAAELARQLKDTALPHAARLSRKLEALYVASRQEHNAVGFMEFNEVIISYYRELSTYQAVVLESLEKEMKPAVRIKADDTALQSFRPDYHGNVRDVMKAFIRESNRTARYLQKCIDGDSNIYDICADRKMQDLVNSIKEMSLIQRGMVTLLQHWEDQQRLNGLQVYYN